MDDAHPGDLLLHRVRPVPRRPSPCWRTACRRLAGAAPSRATASSSDGTAWYDLVGVPVVIAELFQPGRRLSVRADIGDEMDETVTVRSRRMPRDMLFDLAELLGEMELRFLRQVLVAEDEDVVLAERGEDRLARARRQRPRKVDPGDRGAAGCGQAGARSQGREWRRSSVRLPRALCRGQHDPIRYCRQVSAANGAARAGLP